MKFHRKTTLFPTNGLEFHGMNALVPTDEVATGDPNNSCNSVFSSKRDASSNCADAALTRSKKAIAQRARSNPVIAPKTPKAVDLIPLGTASDDSHCFVFSVRSTTSSRDIS